MGCAVSDGDGSSKTMIDDRSTDDTGATTAVTSAPAATAKVTGPLLFAYDSAKPIIGEGWDARRQAILDGLGDDDILEFTGEYRAEEGESVGMDRARATAALFKPPLTDDRIRLLTSLVNGDADDKNQPFKSVNIESRRNTKAIKEIGNKVEIRFPYNSTNKLNDREVEQYLNRVADRVKESGESIKLTGHTDDRSSEAYNMALGMRRAKAVKDYLVSRGVSADKITTSSKGETQPVASNDTKEGRQRNRRTELEIIK